MSSPWISISEVYIKNNMGIIGYDHENQIRIIGKFFGKCWKK